MHPSLPNAGASRTKTRRLAYASAIAGLALAGVVGLGLPQSAVHAQRSDATVQTPMGRAPLSFADIVERVKPAVVSIHVTNGGAEGRPGPQGHPQEPARLPPRPARRSSLERVLQEPAQGVARPARPLAAAVAGPGLGLRRLRRRLRRHQQPRDRRRQQDPGQLRQGQQVRGRADRRRPAHRHRAAQDQGQLEAVHLREVLRQDPAHRRLGAGDRQPVRSRRLGDGRHRLGARPRHRLGPLRLHADRRGREPRQLRRPDLQPRGRGGRRQHRHLQPVGRQRRHRLRHSLQDRRGGGRRSSNPAAPSIAAGSASRSRTSTRTRRQASG